MYKRLHKYVWLMLLTTFLAIGSDISSPLLPNQVSANTETHTKKYQKKADKLKLKNKSVKDAKKALKKNSTFKKAIIKVTDSSNHTVPSIDSLHIDSAKVSSEKFKLDKHGKLKYVYLVTKISPDKVSAAVASSQAAVSSSKQAAADKASSESQAAALSESVAASEAQQASIAASQSQQQAAIASSQAAATAAAAQTPASTGGYTKDYRGRWHRPNGQYASKVEIAQAGLAW